MRRHLEFSMRVQFLRAVYHRAMGEAILFRLAFTDAPEFAVTEDLDAACVTVRMEDRDDTLTLPAGREYAEDVARIREWIEGQVDVSRLTLGKRHTTALAYWRSRALRW